MLKSEKHRAAVRKLYAKRKESGIPRAEDLNRAIVHALRNHFAHFVNIGGNRPSNELLKLVVNDALDILASRGFGPRHSNRLLMRTLQPVSFKEADVALLGEPVASPIVASAPVVVTPTVAPHNPEAAARRWLTS